MRVVSAAEIDRALSYPALVDALAAAFSGDIVAPVRHHHEVEREGQNGTLLLMPAWTGNASTDSFMGVKVVSVFPDNGAKNLPSVLGTYLLMDGLTGEPQAAFDGTRLTVWRTACASALAARHLARLDTTRMVMIGAGSLAPFLIRAHMSQRPIAEVLLWNHRAGEGRGPGRKPAERRPASDGDIRSRGGRARGGSRLLRYPVEAADHPGRMAEGRHSSGSGRRVQSCHARGRRRGAAAFADLRRYAWRQNPKAAMWLWRSRAAPSTNRPFAATCSACAPARPSGTPTPSRCSSPWARPWKILLRQCWCGAAFRLLRRIWRNGPSHQDLRALDARDPRRGLERGRGSRRLRAFREESEACFAGDRPRLVPPCERARAAGGAAGRCHGRGDRGCHRVDGSGNAATARRARRPSA